MNRNVAVLVLLAAIALLVSETGTFVRVSSTDMAPALLPGDLLYVYTRGGSTWEPERGQLVAYTLAVEGLRRHAPDRTPQLPTEAFVGRIAGLPGDRVEVHREVLRIDGERVFQERVAPQGGVPGGRGTIFHLRTQGRHNFVVAGDPGSAGPELSETRVEPDRYLILGDYRSGAYDSRYWGTLRRRDLLGRPLLVVFSREPGGGAVRWSRIGHWVAD